MTLTAGMKLDALLWKWGNGCCCAHINEKTGDVVIDRWDAETPQPSKTKIKNAIKKYEDYLEIIELEKPAKIEALKTKLNLTDEDLALFEEMLK